LKIPVLLEHFSEHKNQDRALDFWSFLAMHYLVSQQAHSDHDQDRDMQLPFKLPVPNVIAYAVLPPSQFTHLELLISFASITKKQYPLPDNDHLPIAHGKSIWQPPKYC
jgi:hypothetical protein